jgi:hypothetical protein
MPIPLGVLAVAGAGAAAGGPAFDLLATTTASGSPTSITFSNINTYTAYKHLQIRWTCRFDSTSTSRGLDLRMNGDGGSNYSGHYLQGEGPAGVSSAAFTNQGKIRLGEAPGTNLSDFFASGYFDILDFSSTTINKTTKAFYGMAESNSPFWRIGLYSGVWRNTSAITSLSMQADNGVAFITGSRFSLYGIKG